MRNPGDTLAEVWEPGNGAVTMNPQTGALTRPPPTLIGTVRGTFGVLTAEEQASRAAGGPTEEVDAYLLCPLNAPVTADAYLVLGGHDAIEGRWAVIGIEWRRTHLRVLLRQGLITG